ncbi:MAG: YiiX/YebB-like N1pC/P60 family cysteine hydrolase [Pirellulaceae bacterium]|nr:hypothetical protein [Planctomycetales bacterium]
MNDESLWLDAARTVTSVYGQFCELKQSADDSIASAAIGAREYLTPSEDEAVRRLLISYWQLRSALLEVVFDLYDRGGESAESYARFFLPGYAGALVLVDAARFLRDRFHGWKTVRRKLNEPEPNFGIPSDVYETTQSLWTRPTHAWRLHEAAEFYHRHGRQWQAEASEADSLLPQLVEIIETLSARWRFTWQEFTKARVRFRSRQAWNMLKRDLFRSAMYQLQKACGILASDRYLKPGHAPSLPDGIRSALDGILTPGDVLLVRKEHALTNYFLPGYWPHSALYVGTLENLQDVGLSRHPHVAPRWQRLQSCDTPNRGRVVEAMKDGVRIRSMNSPYASDSIVVVRPQLPIDIVQAAIARALQHESKEYDFSFDFTTSHRLVCTEVVYRAYDGLGGISFPLLPRAGRLTLAAAEIVQLALERNQFGVVATYVPSCQPQLIRGDDAFAAVRDIASQYRPSTDVR